MPLREGGWWHCVRYGPWRSTLRDQVESYEIEQMPLPATDTQGSIHARW
jgi:hypothetical protein